MVLKLIKNKKIKEDSAQHHYRLMQEDLDDMEAILYCYKTKNGEYHFGWSNQATSDVSFMLMSLQTKLIKDVL